jgi:pentatricopeptide repeat protein
MLSLTRTLGMSPTRRTYLALITSCSQQGRSPEAHALYTTLRQLNFELDAEAGSALISSLCQANQVCCTGCMWGVTA